MSNSPCCNDQPKSDRPRQGGTGRGFSLMEVLVSISILGIVYASLFSLMTGSMRNITRIEERGKIVRYGQMKLNELVLHVRQGTIDRELSGKFDEQYGWQAQVENLDTGLGTGQPPAFLLVRIRLSVIWPAQAGQNFYNLETMTWMPREENTVN